MPFLNGWSYRLGIALYLKVFQRWLICFFKKLSSISRSRDIVVSRRCLQTLFLGSHPYQICISSQLIFLKMKTETYIQNQYSIQKLISWASICHIVEGPRMPTSRDMSWPFVAFEKKRTVVKAAKFIKGTGLQLMTQSWTILALI